MLVMPLRLERGTKKVARWLAGHTYKKCEVDLAHTFANVVEVRDGIVVAELEKYLTVR